MLQGEILFCPGCNGSKILLSLSSSLALLLLSHLLLVWELVSPLPTSLPPTQVLEGSFSNTKQSRVLPGLSWSPLLCGFPLVWLPYGIPVPSTSYHVSFRCLYTSYLRLPKHQTQHHFSVLCLEFPAQPFWSLGNQLHQHLQVSEVFLLRGPAHSHYHGSYHYVVTYHGKLPLCCNFFSPLGWDLLEAETMSDYSVILTPQSYLMPILEPGTITMKSLKAQLKVHCPSDHRLCPWIIWVYIYVYKWILLVWPDSFVGVRLHCQWSAPRQGPGNSWRVATLGRWGHRGTAHSLTFCHLLAPKWAASEVVC